MRAMKRHNGVWRLFGGLVIFSLVLWWLDGRGWLDWWRRPVERLINPAKREVYRRVAVKEERGECERQRAELEAEVARLREENEKMRRLLGAPLPPDWQFVLAHVTGKEGGRLWLDVGKDQGVRGGLAVVVENNLVGRVVRVTPRMSEVQLVIDEEFETDGQLAGGVVEGKVRGRPGGRVFFEEVLTKYNLGEGQVVVTGGRELPAGLVVGRVAAVEKVESEVYQRALLESLVEWEGLETVFVVREAD